MALQARESCLGLASGNRVGAKGLWVAGCSEAAGEALGTQCSVMENAAGLSLQELLQGLGVGKLSLAEGSLPRAAGLCGWLSSSFLAGCWSRGMCALVQSAVRRRS